MYDLVKDTYPVIDRFPKAHKQVLGKEIEETCLKILTNIIKANKSRTNERFELQICISDELDCLRILIRLSKDLKYISIKQYLSVSERLNEIAKLLYSWSK